ncbi:MAG: alpha/beta fold hydrolase [Candidatus Malihini olakiniferum]
MKLNYRMQNAQLPTHSLPIILIHALFGNLDNLGVLAHDLQKQHDIIQIDLRNYELSPRSPEMNYLSMTSDVKELLNTLNIEQAIIIVHAMGGKTAMALSAQIPGRIEKIIAIDIALVDITNCAAMITFFATLRAVTAAGVTTRTEAAAIMRHYLKEEGMVQFLLKSFQQRKWRFNVPVLWEQYEHIVGWETVPAWQKPILFIRGAASPCLDDRYRKVLLQQLPNAKAHLIAGSDH